jgi:hypothetical protein
MATETVAEAYLSLLAARGIDYLFGNGGTDFGPIVEAYARRMAAEEPYRVTDRLYRPRTRSQPGRTLPTCRRSVSTSRNRNAPTGTTSSQPGATSVIEKRPLTPGT